MDEKIKEFTTSKLQEVKDGKNPVTVSSEVDGYLEALRDTGIITPIEYVDAYYEFSINVVKTLSPNIESENVALAKLNGWKAVIETIALQM